MLQLAAHHGWDKQQKPAKNETHKIREINWLYFACTSLTILNLKFMR